MKQREFTSKEVKNKEVLHTQGEISLSEFNRDENFTYYDIDLSVQDINPEIGQLKISHKYDKYAELICKAVNYYNNNKLAFDLATKAIEGSEAMQNERQRLIEENEKVKRLLHDLTPGGSEFYNDPEYCAKWVSENRTENHYILTNMVKEQKAENKMLIDSNRELVNKLEYILRSWNTEICQDYEFYGQLKTAINNAKNILP